MRRPRFDVVEPSTGRTVRQVDGHGPDEVSARVRAAVEAQPGWRAQGFPARAAILRATADRLEARASELAGRMTDEMGKLHRDGVAEVKKCAWVCRYYAEHAERFLADEPATTDARDSFVRHLPLGVILAVMPWNFPFWQVFRFAAPALMAGNVGLLKHASNVPGCAVAIEEVLAEAGLPDGAFSTLLIGSSEVDGLIADPAIAAVTLTGSTEAGRKVGESAGRNLKKVVLELGGSDPYLILEDADLDAAVEACATSRLINAGQSCIAAKRFLVVDAVYDAFLTRFVARMKAARMGDPHDPSSDLGPQARVDLRDELHAQVTRAIEGGARLALGGEVPDRSGAWYPPTVLAEVPEGNPALVEELFGPVAAVQRVRDEDHAVEQANASVFGLGAAVFTRDLDRGRRIAAERLDAGACFVNTFVKADPRVPFGGIKQSGHGRELARQGILEFVNAKTVWVG